MSDTPETEFHSLADTHTHPPRPILIEGERVVTASFAAKLERERDAARAELAELQKDKARLDWLDAEVVDMVQDAAYRFIRRRFKIGKDYLKHQYSTLRQAIDAAMDEEVDERTTYSMAATIAKGD